MRIHHKPAEAQGEDAKARKVKLECCRGLPPPAEAGPQVYCTVNSIS